MVSLTGLKLGAYLVHEEIGRGAFGTIYRATDAEGKSVAVKVAHEHAETSNSRDQYSVALALYSGGYGNINPVPEKLLEIQSTRSNIAGEIFPQTSIPFSSGTTAYIVMELINGVTLRQFMKEFPMSDLQQALYLFEVLASLQKSPAKFHGDLKPENVMVSADKFRLLDPGYFGSLNAREGVIPRAVITTSAYYPTLEPDDSFAAGCILWEICLGLHPLSGKQSQTRRIGPNLLQAITFQEMMGRYFLSPIKNLPLPNELYPQLSAEVCELLLSSIGLQLLPDGSLEKLSAALSAQAVISKLADLKTAGMAKINPYKRG